MGCIRWKHTYQDRADRNGNFKTRITIPGTAQKGQHTVYAVSNKGVRAIANFNVDIISVYGSVKARLRGGLPLQGVEVRLFREDPGGTIQDLGSSVTDEQGKYRIYSPALRVPMPGHLLLRVTLRESQLGTYTLFDATVDDTVVPALFGRYGEIGAKQGDVSTWFTIDTSRDLDKNLWFEDRNDDHATKTIREDHALDAALIYYHTHQVMRFYRNLGAPFTTTPVNVRIYSPNPTSCSGNLIDINADDSDWNSGDAPKNREWHEFSHYIMWDVYGAFPPQHYEAGNDFNGNDVIDEDVNHGGYWGNWLSSSDAITEGFAEFMAMVIADQMNRQGEIYMQDHIEPYIYTVGSPFPYMLNFEINHPQTIYPYVPAVFTGVSILDEEFCVASTLWDLYDGIDDGDRDHVSLTIDEIWQMLSRTYTFPQYYNGVAITRFTGDLFTYAGSWSGSSYTGVRSLKVPIPTTTRYIWYIKDLYDALNWSLLDQNREIDELFFRHKIYVDTFRIYEDYTSLGMDDISTFGDEASKIDHSISPEATHEFWGKGVSRGLRCFRVGSRLHNR